MRYGKLWLESAYAAHIRSITNHLILRSWFPFDISVKHTPDFLKIIINKTFMKTSIFVYRCVSTFF